MYEIIKPLTGRGDTMKPLQRWLSFPKPHILLWGIYSLTALSGNRRTWTQYTVLLGPPLHLPQPCPTTFCPHPSPALNFLVDSTQVTWLVSFLLSLVSHPSSIPFLQCVVTQALTMYNYIFLTVTCQICMHVKKNGKILRLWINRKENPQFFLKLGSE